jgi:hypothetical protein
MPELQVPDVFGEIVGWRAWKVIGDRPTVFPMLASVTHGHTIWHPGYWTEADCFGRPECDRSHDGRIPGESCTCGLYCARTRAQLIGLRYGRPMTRPDRHGRTFPKVVGEVGLVGKVIPGSQGWRGEKGRIVRLYVPFEHWRLIEPLERLYRVEAVLDNTQRYEQTKLGGE